MSSAISKVPYPKNEPAKSYAPGTQERSDVIKELEKFKSKLNDIPLLIGEERVETEDKRPILPPHDHQNPIGYYHVGNEYHVRDAINAALGAKGFWNSISWEQRASIFLKAADLLTGPYRAKMNAATMLGQSKTVHQAEIEAVCELADFLRYNAWFMTQIYSQQPYSPDGVWNRVEYRPLEGFVFAITPFNFTAIAGNLPSAPALMGNTSLWKPNITQILAANVFLEILKEAGLPGGVINLIIAEDETLGNEIFTHSDFAGLHFTGSTAAFKKLWKKISENIDKYKSYPRIVGETGGKDFVIAHSSADPYEVSTAIIRGAFEFQGQKCSAVSRAYIPNDIWDNVKDNMLNELQSVKMGSPEDFTNFMCAVIDETAFNKITSYIDYAKENENTEIIWGGNYDGSYGYFVEPTVIVSSDPSDKLMKEEIFGPVVTIYVFVPERWEMTLELVDGTSPYALTGAVFAKERYAIDQATEKLKNAAGNFYINDKPTGSIVGQQPFGGARQSGTNDKAGSVINLYRWCSMRSIKENFVPPKDFRYPYMNES